MLLKMALLTQKTRPVILLCDRGIMDVKAHLSPQNWEEVLEELKIEDADRLCLERYDGVVHLESCASNQSTLTFYSTQDNQARTDSYKWAQELDQRCTSA